MAHNHFNSPSDSLLGCGILKSFTSISVISRAKFFEENNCGWVFDQIKNSKSDFKNLIVNIFKNKDQLVTVSQKTKELSHNLSKLRKSKTPTGFLSDLVLKMTDDPKKEVNNLC